MPKTFIAQNVVKVNPLHFVLNEIGEVIDLLVNCEVNYGEMGMTHQVSLWADLTPAEKAKAQGVFNRVCQLITAHFMG